MGRGGEVEVLDGRRETMEGREEGERECRSGRGRKEERMKKED